MNSVNRLHRAGTASRVTAILGPTNTGKTHFAIERMLAHRSGMIGLPLRLLAREVYDKVVRLKGASATALLTGEEKLVPKDARYFVCTVEAMPLDVAVGCLVVDEIQLCADLERGHVFTDRLLHARGEEETIFLGADTMRGSIQRFVPSAHFTARSRFSDLAYTGPKKLTRLPRRSAVVGFSAEDVYGIAELIRRQRGGAAVVLGALSPRTRNAQVELYQNGDVDFLVATDAIGMGLNMDIDHIAFAALDKFDGNVMRPLRPDEVGQIAGRAGRHMNDGTFGTTGEADVLDEELVSRVEAHRYDPLRVLQWRNSNLDFHSIDGLLGSLDEAPNARGLAKARPVSDFAALRVLSVQKDVQELAVSRSCVHRLWEACQIPDFRKLSSDDHIRLVHTIFLYLMGNNGVLPDDWLARQIERLNVTEGDVATLSGRLAQIRTWTFVSHRPHWTRDHAHWQETTRAVEDRLSDALHERLTQRFVDRRTSVLMKRLREDDAIDLSLDDSGGVAIGGEIVGKLEGFRFEADPKAEGIHGRTLRAAATRALEGEFIARARRLSEASDQTIQLSEHGKLWWEGAVVGHLSAGARALAPQIVIFADDKLKGEWRERVKLRLERLVHERIALRLQPLLALTASVEAKAGTGGALTAPARAIAHQLLEHFGSLERARIQLPGNVGPLLHALKGHGIWFGRRSIYFPKLLRPDAAGLLALLWGVWTGQKRLFSAPQPGLTSFINDANQPSAFLAAAGFRSVGTRAIRLDMLERLEETLEEGATAGIDAMSLLPKLVSLIGSSNEELKDVLAVLGWHIVPVGAHNEGMAHVWRKRPTKARSRTNRRDSREQQTFKVEIRLDSPFAGLAALVRK